MSLGAIRSEKPFPFVNLEVVQAEYFHGYIIMHYSVVGIPGDH